MPGLEFPTSWKPTCFTLAATALIDQVGLSNEAAPAGLAAPVVVQGVQGPQSNRSGFHLYAELGINQLGAVYEGPDVPRTDP